MGVASWRWVRPILTMWSQAWAWAVRRSASDLMAGRSSCSIMSAAAMCIAVGKVSLEDWDMLTWSLGWTPPRAIQAGSLEEPMGWWWRTQTRFATTSLTFML